MRTIIIGVLLTVAVTLGTASTAGSLAAPSTAPDLTVKPSKVGFGRVTVGLVSKGKDITITNNSGVRLMLDGPATNAATPTDFGFSTQGCSSFDTGVSCTSRIVFHPTTAGKVINASWTVVFRDAAMTSYSATFTVSGTGIAP